MEAIDPVSSNNFEDQTVLPDTLTDQWSSIYVGKTNLCVRLAGDMDERFLERLGRILRNETSPV